MIADIFYYISISIVAGTISYVMAKGQSLVSQNLQSSISKQPYSASSNTKLNIVALALLEAPALLTSVCIIYLTEARNHIGVYFGIGLAVMCALLALVSSKTISSSSIIASKAGKAIANNPQYGQRVSNLSLIYISLMQTPLIFLLVICILSIARTSGISTYETSEISLLWTMLSPLAVGGAAYGVLRGMEHYLSSAMEYAFYNPQNFSSSFGRSLLTLAFIEAPVLFSFVISVLTSVNIFTDAYQILPALFGIICFIVTSISVSLQSARVSSTAIEQKISTKTPIDKHTENNIFQLSFLSQVLLDGRIVYMFIILLFILLKLNPQ